jgi:hypothetical protein
LRGRDSIFGRHFAFCNNALDFEISIVKVLFISLCCTLVKISHHVFFLLLFPKRFHADSATNLEGGILVQPFDVHVAQVLPLDQKLIFTNVALFFRLSDSQNFVYLGPDGSSDSSSIFDNPIAIVIVVIVVVDSIGAPTSSTRSFGSSRRQLLELVLLELLLFLSPWL